MITTTALYRRVDIHDDLARTVAEAIQTMEDAGWAVRQIIPYNQPAADTSIFVVYERPAT